MKYHAIESPNWLRKSAIYQINLRMFSEEGTINAVVSELFFLKELGFDVIYLCPVFEADNSEDRTYWSERQKKFGTNNPKNSYRMKNHFEIDSEYGTMDDLKNFVKAVHDLDMKVLLDLVYLHVGPDATILESHPEFAIRDEHETIIQNRYHFVGLDFNCQGLREYLWTNMVYLISETNVDGFRCDVPDTIPNDFWAEGRRRIQAIKPDAILINEGRDVSRLASTFDACYGLAWQSDLNMVLNGKKKVCELRQGHEELSTSIPTDGIMVRMLDNHDTVTNWPERSEIMLGHDGMELVQVLHYVMDGIAMVFAGNELADTAKVNMFANRFYMGEYEVTDRNKKNTPESVRRQEIYKRLNKFRKECDIITKGTMSWIENSEPESAISFEREYEGKRIVFVGNLSEADIRVTLNVKLDDGESIFENKCATSGNTVELASHGYMVVEL